MARARGKQTLTAEEKAALPSRERIQNCPVCGSDDVARSKSEDGYTKHRHNICQDCRHMWRDMARAKPKVKP